MKEDLTPNPTVTEWPKVKLGGVEDRFTLRYSHSADYILHGWGKNIASALDLELAAACAGNFDKKGRWISANFYSPMEFIDLVEEAEFRPLMDAVAVAVKNRYPTLEVSAVQTPGKSQMPALKTIENDSSDSGPSPQADPVLDSATPVSGN